MRELIIFAVLLFISTAASADWQYTKWGMTPEEVVAASGGRAFLVTPKPEEIADQTATMIECSADYQAGAFAFNVMFEFDKRTRRLREVSLLYAGLDPYGLEQAMQEKYGFWTKGTIWLDHKAGYSVEMDASLDPVIFINYGPLHDAEKEGL